VIFDVGGESLQRVPMTEPLRGTEDAVKDLLDVCPDAQTLLEKLQG
jgi:proteasome accessory factor A